MDLHIGYIMTVSNSIIGVSILAMPYCFKQCGIILAILMLLASGIVSRLTCHYLLKSANISRRRTFELLSFHAFGSMGKLMVELGIIGFLMGTCIAYFVIIGDLGPAILAKILEIENNDRLRMTLLICLAVFCVVPLGLLKNVDSLNSVSIATIGFYFCLVLKTMSESATHLASEDLFSKVELWKPQGVLQCFPIFAMALSCQTQLFEIYETLPNASLEKMNYVVRSAVNICVCVYIMVGFFGYVAFVNYPFTGNILMSFSPSLMTDAMKIGFVLSVACSFPLVIFPCRASLYSLLFKKGYMHPYEGSSNFIPENRFKLLTLFIVGVSLIIGILIPNIEVVLGLLGSTIGIMICVIFPVTCFICISMKNTNERILAQILLFVGIIMMVMGTYANLYAMEEINTSPPHLDRIQLSPIDKVMESKPIINKMKDKYVIDIKKGKILKDGDPLKTIIDIVTMKPEVKVPEPVVEVRKEPPQPVEPAEPDEPVVKEPVVKDVPIKVEEKLLTSKEIVPPVKEKLDEPKTTKATEVDKAAIEKEENEIKEEVIKNKDEDIEKDKNADDLLKTLEKHKEEQKNLIQQQKELLEEIKKETKELKDKHLEDIQKDNELRAKAAHQIVEIAKKAIESLGPKDETIKNAEKIIESLGNAKNNNTEQKTVKNDEKIEAERQKSPPIKSFDKTSLNENETPPKIVITQNLPEVSKKETIPLPIVVNMLENVKNVENNLKTTNDNTKNVISDQKLDNKLENPQDLPKETLQKPKEPEVKEIPLIEPQNIAEKITTKIDQPVKNDLPKSEGKEEKNEKIGRDILQNNDATEKVALRSSVTPILNKNTSKIGRDLLETNTENLVELQRKKREVDSQNDENEDGNCEKREKRFIENENLNNKNILKSGDESLLDSLKLSDNIFKNHENLRRK